MTAMVETTFVGRQRELATLRASLGRAIAGSGGVALLVGEAGIGKTWIAREFVREAQQDGAIVLWGRCFEGEWQPPYGPWVEALAELVGGLGRVGRVDGIEPEHLRRELGAGAAPLGQLVPELHTALPDLPPPVPLRPDEMRLRLYEAVTRVLRTAPRNQPIVLVLDDLHWADRDTLQLLWYVARSGHRSRLLIVGVYRDPDPDFGPTHPLHDTLAILRHEASYEHIAVSGLDYPEAAAYLAQAAGQGLPRSLVQAIYAETDGNPFYTQEVFRHLVEERKIVRRAERWSTDAGTGDLGIPDGEIAPTDRPVELRVCEGWRIADGKIVSLRNYQDAAGLMRQLGLLA
jgi:eukaryotic-like serine/threonine-protein kinase